MLVSLRELIEAAIAAGEPYFKASGAVTDWAALYDPANLALLDNEHDGVFAFLAFHPVADEAVAAYVAERTLASDSGAHTLVFFTLEAEARRGGRANRAAGFVLDDGLHPAYEAVRLLYEPAAPPSLPGIVFTPELFGPADVIFVPLTELDGPAAVRERLREVFALAEAAWRRSGRDGFPAALATSLLARQTPYDRRERTSAREWLIKGYQVAIKRGADLVTLIGALKGA
jgi:hypothetical protein